MKDQIQRIDEAIADIHYMASLGQGLDVPRLRVLEDRRAALVAVAITLPPETPSEPEREVAEFEVGQRVVCIDGRFHHSVYEWGDHVPVIGMCYTVRGLVPNGCPLDNSRSLGLHLVEIVNPPTSNGGELNFSARRFAPLELEESEEGQAEEELVMVGREARNEFV